MLKRFIKIFIVGFVVLILLGSSVFAVTGKVIGSTVRIREKASSDSHAISVAKKGEKVEILGEEGDWYQVKFEKITGYISKEYVETDGAVEKTVTAPEPTPVPEPEQKPATEPKTEPLVQEPETVPEGQVTEQQSNESESSVQIQEYKENQTVTFSQQADLRYLPSFTSRVNATVESGSTYTVKASLNNWVKVVNDSNGGWILKNFIEKKVTDENKESEVTIKVLDDNQNTATQEVSKGKTNVDSARIRKAPDGEVLESLSKGTEVTILGEEGDWYKISTSNHENCYISKRLITKN